MPCLPESGGCERRFLEPFVEHLNALEGSDYRHSQCLDVAIRHVSQPEALYVDVRGGLDLVIERKCIIWPEDYAAGHANDHKLYDRLHSLLPDWALKGPYTAVLPCLGREARGTVDALATEIAEAVAEASPLFSEQLAGGSGKYRWAFRRRNALDDDSAPLDRILFVWFDSAAFDLPPWPVPLDLRREIERVLHAAAEKFASYRQHRCIILLEPHGSLAHTPVDWWLPLVRLAGPASVPELWLAEEDFADPDGQPFWLFERLLPNPNADRGCAY